MRYTAYTRVSTEKQEILTQQLAINQYAANNNLEIYSSTRIEISSREDINKRRIKETLDGMQRGDTLIVSELSRLGRKMIEVLQIVEEIRERGLGLICIKENIHIDQGKQDMASKMLLGMFGLMAELERDLISQRTKEGLARAKAQGKKLGRPKGAQKSKLDDHKADIQEMLLKGVPYSKIAARYGTSKGRISTYVKSRKLESPNAKKEKK